MINQVYDSLVDAVRSNSHHSQKLLEQLGEKLLNANPGCCHSVEDGMRLARTNLSLYANFFPRRWWIRCASITDLQDSPETPIRQVVRALLLFSETGGVDR